MIPLIKELAQDRTITNKICITGQHRELMDQILKYYSIKPDYDLNVMQFNQDLSSLTVKIIEKVQKVISEERPSLVLVHGDTTSAFAAALASFYEKIPIAHIESGLRTHNIHSPFPEEMNRVFIDKIASILFAPTVNNLENLIKEGINKEKIWVTGNTGIDMLKLTAAEFGSNSELSLKTEKNLDEKIGIKISKEEVVLVTIHRRENFGNKLDNILDALIEVSNRYPRKKFLFTVHPNPNLHEKFESKLGRIKNILLTEPLEYHELIYVLMNCALVVTDSGGIQEEAVSLGTPIVVVRDSTERIEGIASKKITLSKTNKYQVFKSICKEIEKIKKEKDLEWSNIFGDGNSSKQIVEIIKICNLSLELLRGS